MRRLLPVLLLVATLAAGARMARADDGEGGGGPFGLGLIVGEPTGVSGKLYLKKRHAIDAALGIGFADGRGVHVHADYLWHPVILTQAPSFDLWLYIGLGARLQSHGAHGATASHVAIGPRFPAGVLFAFRNTPIDAFIEAAIGFDLAGSGEGNQGRGGVTLDLGLGVRYYF